MITEKMKDVGARVLVDLGLLPVAWGSDVIAETVFQEMLDASPYKLELKKVDFNKPSSLLQVNATGYNNA